VRGTTVVYSRVEIGAIPPPGNGLLRIRLVRPSGVPAGEQTAGLRTQHGHGYWWFSHQVRLSPVGRWRITVDFDGKTLADEPIDVVASASAVRNRPPRAISAALLAASPTPGEVVECRVSTSLVAEDPDFDIVRYRYRWTIDGTLVRAVQSAALSDVLRKGLATSGKNVRCTVTPSDGRLSGPAATVSASAR
jgi:hypothetical protein